MLDTALPPDAAPSQPQPAEELSRQLRAELARELHDRVAQTLTAVLVDMEVAKRGLADRATASRVDAFQRETRAALDGLRDVLCGLREEDRLERAFATRLRRLLERRSAARPGSRLTLTVSAGWPAVIRARAAQHLLQIAGEAVHNAQLHGRAGQVDVALRAGSDGSLAVTVADDGRGLKDPDRAPRAGFGLLGMRERAALLGGRFEIGERPGGGTRLRLSFRKEDLA